MWKYIKAWLDYPRYVKYMRVNEGVKVIILRRQYAKRNAYMY